METTRLKLKIGEHEFDADGPAEIVQAQFAAWRELIATVPAPAPKLEPTITDNKTQDQGAARNGLALDKIMKQDGRYVSLTARGDSLEDEIMLILVGQKTLRTNDAVSGTELLEGLRQT